ncbi:MAG: c-type cytochrome [Sphingomonadales bacterium]|nr:c-type cytochrome [Sphingomonadales bacterium]MDE2570645.1 c-type cytochrome [Sphingomonadales bacterium]
MGRILKIAAPFVALGALTAGGLMSPAFGASPQAGAKDFASQCAMCHTHAAGARSGIGPNLFGVVGRKAGTLAGYSYSSAMKSAGFDWSSQKLEAYLTKPQQIVHGNKMPYAGLGDAAKRADVVAYLATLK